MVMVIVELARLGLAASCNMVFIDKTCSSSFSNFAVELISL